MKTIAVFQSDLFDRTWPEDVNDALPWGKDLAEYLITHLRAAGASIFYEPIQGVEGWEVDGVISNIPFSLFVHWFPFGSHPSKDYWAIQPSIRHGLIATLFGKRDKPSELAPLCQVLDQILRSEIQIVNLQWLTKEDFSAIY
jgi:hypothetical protein